ncbi:hypothetical protein NHQ30_000619 [Ciborinia camelliae]|nr:hypothetical protein NHQ30_000619 [Ciborinia camelliae]
MSQDLRVDSYLQYKSGTKAVFTWLVTTAQLCNFFKDDKSSSIKSTHSFPLAKYAEIARFIASCTQPKIKVSQQLLSTLKNVIHLRKAFSFMHQQKETEAGPEKLDSNNRHQYIISILEDIFGCLEPLRLHELKIHSSTSNSDEQVDELDKNLFDVLDIEDMEDKPTSQHLVKTEGKGKKTSRGRKETEAGNYDCDEDKSEAASLEELYFMMFCFFKDLNDIREYLQNIWIEYREQKLPLETASITTDLAFDVVRRKESQFMNQEIFVAGKLTTVEHAIAELGASQTVSAVGLYWATAEQSEIRTDTCVGKYFANPYIGDLLFGFIGGTREQQTLLSPDDQDAFLLRQYGIANWLCIPQYIMMSLSQAICEDKETPEGCPLTAISSVENSAGLSVLKQFECDSETMKGFSHSFVELALIAPNDLPMDLWTKTMTQMVTRRDPGETKSSSSKKKGKNQQSRPIPTWLIWATSIIINIGRASSYGEVSSNSIGRSFQELRSFGFDAKRKLQQHFDWSSFWPRPVHSVFDRVIQKTVRELEIWVINDKVTRLTDASSECLEWLKIHSPLWCGILLTSYRLTLWSFGIELTNMYRSILLAIHLCNFTNTKSKNDFEWKDIEYLIELHGAEWLFLGSRPDKDPDYLTRIMLASGKSVKNYAAISSRPIDHPYSSRGVDYMRTLRVDAIKLHMLMERYNALMLRPAKYSSLDGLEILVAWQKDQSSKAAPTKHSSQESFIIPLLQMGSNIITDNQPHLLFDYFDMHRRCWDLLMNLHHGVSQNIYHKRIEITYDNYSLLQTWPFFVFDVSGALGGHRDWMEHTPMEALQVAPVIQITCGIIEDFVSSQGSIGLEQVDRLMKNMGGNEETKLLPGIEVDSSNMSNVMEAIQQDDENGGSDVAETEAPQTKKRNNKNKNKNRKLKKQAKREQGEPQIEDTALPTSLSTANSIQSST